MFPIDDPVLWISTIIVLLAVGGMFILADIGSSDGLTGYVVQECTCSGGDPVCAAVGHTLDDYASSCDAECSGARVVYLGYCKDIPTTRK